MKNYKITVNGKSYDVTVEEAGTVAAEAAAPAPARVQPPKAPAPAPQKKEAKGPAGAVSIEASVPGKIIKVDAPAGTAVKAGDAVITLEAMKMEIPVVAPKDGTIASIEVAAGDAVESGDILATMN